MAEEKSEGGATSLLANPSALLALVTVAGGLWLVSQKLTSDRPVTPAGGSKGFIGDQKLEARLWEDPFKRNTRDENTTSLEGSSGAIDLNMLAGQIQRRSSPEHPSKAVARAKPANTDNGVLLLPVMLSGGQYSEDQESRIRSRFAIVSALGRAGYAPEDAEHIGVLKTPWLTQQEVDDAKWRPSEAVAKITRLWEDKPGTASRHGVRLLGIETSDQSAQMEVRYEWYLPRAFGAAAAIKPAWSGILVLWLDDSYFEDDALLRLPLLFERLTDPERFTPKIPPPSVALIGPRRSSTLRNMLPDWKSGATVWSNVTNRSLETLARKVLGRIDIYCATPSAMDEVLVKNPKDPTCTPRAAVGTALSGEGFHSFRNFAATDAQMAAEILDELALRNADLKNLKNHVVLISEWDTFYARMLSLTYGAELATMQLKKGDYPPARAEFVGNYISKPEIPDLMPLNFHSFVYLRGLDGQTVGGEGRTKDVAGDGDRNGKSHPNSLEEFSHWSPDVNQAEGQAQFDYLGRLGDQLDELQKSIRRKNQGEIKAIGIVGSDVYDTLLVLQALRHRFPEVLFFTTDLDVRFLYPAEREWARNLIVASSYGLALHDSLQGPTAPFRDSTQTAQFAAALAALGNADLQGIVRIPPRRFEVGNRTMVDLSVASSELITTNPRPGDSSSRWLHPLTASETYSAPSARHFQRVGWGLGAAALLLVGASLVWVPFRRFTWEAFTYPCEALEYSEEDIGGPDGVESILHLLDEKPPGVFAGWEEKHPLIDKSRHEVVQLREELKQVLEKLDKIPPDKTAERKKLEEQRIEVAWKGERALGDLTHMLAKRMNRFLHQEAASQPPGRVAPNPAVAGGLLAWAMRRLRHLTATNRVIRLYETRSAMDAFLDQTTIPSLSHVMELPAVGTGEAEGIRLRVTRRLKTTWGEVSRFFDVVLGDPVTAKPDSAQGQPGVAAAAHQAAVAARDSAKGIFRLRCRRLASFWVSVAGFGLVTVIMVRSIWYDTFEHAKGEAFSLTSGTSGWPAEVLRLLVFALAICFCFGLSQKMRESFLALTREFRLSPEKPGSDGSMEPPGAQSIWYEYREGSRFRRRLRCIFWIILSYLALLRLISMAFGEPVLNPVRGDLIKWFDVVLLLGSILGFILLAFLTVDAACQCRGFIKKVGDSLTKYPEATRRHFSRLKGRINEEYLDEWIDLQLIAALTEQVGKLVYYPAGLVLLLILARNSWWDCWPWPISLIVIFSFNFILALASVVILQTAAKAAKLQAEKRLTVKVRSLEAESAPSAVQNNATQAGKLLEEIQKLDRGAFVPFWENPVVVAVFFSSGGTTLLQVFIWFMGR